MRKILLPLTGLLALGACADTQQTQGPVGLARDMSVAEVALQHTAPAPALRIAHERLTANPDDVDALVIQGRAEALQGHAIQAEASFTRALALAPNNTQALLGLGRLHVHARPTEAEALFRRALAISPNDAAAQTDLAVALDMQGHHAEAQALYRRVISLNPEDNVALVDLGLSLALSGQAEAALPYLMPMAQAANSAGRLRGNAAFALVQSGRSDQALALLQSYLPADQAHEAVKRYAELHPTP